MKPKLSLSIALASYNGEHYLREQLDSIARQTRLPDELVISDDASVDATSIIACEFALNAIRACRGNIIFLCDQDDSWYPDKVAQIEQHFINHPDAGAVFTDGDVVDKELNLLGLRLWKIFKFNSRQQVQISACDALGVLLKHPVVTGATMAFRATYRDLILPIPDPGTMPGSHYSSVLCHAWIYCLCL